MNIKKIMSIIGVILLIIIVIVIFMTMSFNFFNNSSANYKEEFNNIDEIKINVNTANIRIQKGANYKIEETSSKRRLKVEFKDNILQVNEQTSIIPSTNSENTIIITVKNSELRNINIKSQEGIIELSSIKTNKINVNNSTGELSISDSNINNANINLGKSRLNVTGSTFNNSTINSDNTNMAIIATLTGTNKINSGTGRLNLELLGAKETYKLNIENKQATVKVDNKVFDIANNIYQTGENEVTISSKKNININFK